MDGSYVRAHQHSAGIANQSISKSVGGNSSKIHWSLIHMAILSIL